MITWRLPQPYEELDHTADAGVRVHAPTREACLARLILGFGQMLAGGGAVEAAETLDLTVPGSGDDVVLAVDVMRAVADAFFDRHLIPSEVTVVTLDGAGANLQVAYGPWRESLHADGLDIKAVTWHAAAFEPADAGWVAQVVFDI